MSAKAYQQVKAEKDRLIEARNIAESEKRLYVKVCINMQINFQVKNCLSEEFSSLALGNVHNISCNAVQQRCSVEPYFAWFFF